MEHNVNIQDELLQVAPSLAAIGRQMPNRQPDGYFDTLPFELLLKTAPAIDFKIPEGYFETLPLEILLKASSLPTKASVPQGYFDHFASNMLAKVKALEAGDEGEELSPLLKSIGKKTPYSVPEGYFDQVVIPSSIPSIAPQTTERAAPVVQIKPRRNYFSWVAAACTIGIVSLLTWQFGLRNNGNQPNYPVAQVDPKIETVDSLAATLELAAALAQLEVNSLEKALSQTSTANEDTHSAVFYLNTDNFENAVKDLSDEELEQYLQESAGVSKKS